MTAIVRCECCGHRQRMERRVYHPEAFYCVCADCEKSLRVEVTADDIAKARADGAARRAKVRT